MRDILEKKINDEIVSAKVTKKMHFGYLGGTKTKKIAFQNRGEVIELPLFKNVFLCYDDIKLGYKGYYVFTDEVIQNLNYKIKKVSIDLYDTEFNLLFKTYAGYEKTVYIKFKNEELYKHQEYKKLKFNDVLFFSMEVKNLEKFQDISVNEIEKFLIRKEEEKIRQKEREEKFFQENKEEILEAMELLKQGVDKLVYYISVKSPHSGQSSSIPREFIKPASMSGKDFAKKYLLDLYDDWYYTDVYYAALKRMNLIK